MRTTFKIEVRKSNGDLHVIPKGDLDGSTAWELVNLLDEQYDGKGRVIIDTHSLREMHPFGCGTFRCRLNQIRLPLSRLSFEGEKGYDIAPRGSVVHVSPEGHRCRCNGNCAHCPCGERKV